MREHFLEVLELQHQHSSSNTPEMIRRGDLIRNVIPAELRSWAAAKPSAVLPFKGRLNVQGRDGTGLKTFVPWVRIHSPELSPSAQRGWYVVYLFRADGSGVALCVSHGSTRFDGGDFKPRSAAEAQGLMTWGRSHIGPEAHALGFEEGVLLNSPEKLSRAYESTTAFSKFYAVDDLPEDEELAQDAERAVGLLGLLYRAVELGKAPESNPPEIVEAEGAVTQIARPKSTETQSAGQGFGLSHAERCLVEQRAMTLASAWLADHGFTNIQDVHVTHSCDFIAHRDGIEHFIEVKGTTAGLGKVLLTSNEVALHRERHPHNLLIVVHGVDLHEMRSSAIGGTVHVIDGWDLQECVLKPLSYLCELPKV